MNYISIEKAGFHAWPAFRQINNEGWVLRFAGGYTKRANSVTILSPNALPLESQIIRCEKAYNTEKLPCIFRLLSFNDNSRIESILDSRGYGLGDNSLVLVQEIQNKEFNLSELDELKVDEWMVHYCRLSEKDINDHSTHIKMVNKIKDDVLLVVFRKGSTIVSCGLGVIHEGFFGIFDIVTHPEHRNMGCGTELINGMLSWAVKRKAHTAYVQVVSDNKSAVRLYHKLGYILGYEYHYKIQNLDR
jgi:ribosomal protein S18 acetylase RimI-like enzyme